MANVFNLQHAPRRSQAPLLAIAFCARTSYELKNLQLFPPTSPSFTKSAQPGEYAGGRPRAIHGPKTALAKQERSEALRAIVQREASREAVAVA